MENVLDIIRNTDLDYPQKRAALASAAENSLPYLPLPERARRYLDAGVIHDLNEGHAPYRPRYILPDYALLIANGSSYLNLAAPRDLYDAVNALLIAYRNVPSITGYPVYLGQIDELLEPFAGTVSADELRKLLRLFLINIDRTLPDAFVHMNIGPRDTRIGRLVLELERELKKAVPNISLKYSAGTSDEFARLAVACALDTSKPYFVNHDVMVDVLGERYGIASCYNTLPLGGGSFTLPRLNLKEAAGLAKDAGDFLGNILPDAVGALCEIVAARARFIVREARFFESSWLAREGLISRDRFTAMAGFYGLYECVQRLSGGLRMGHDRSADDLADRIMTTASALVKAERCDECRGTGGRITVHAQSGIDTDVDVTAGVRIRIGDESALFDQIRLQSRLQRHFDSGVSDIYIFESTARDNPDGVLRIIKGAMMHGMRLMALNTSDSELIRITGYLVKRSDVERYRRGEQLREGTVKLGADSITNNRTLERRVRSLGESE
ncbi:MAG: YjjI family glycine radical enzyme [Chloroflexota bacterium]